METGQFMSWTTPVHCWKSTNIYLTYTVAVATKNTLNAEDQNVC